MKLKKVFKFPIKMMFRLLRKAFVWFWDRTEMASVASLQKEQIRFLADEISELRSIVRHLAAESPAYQQYIVETRESFDFQWTNLSEGRGTTRPFELIGAPWFNSEVVAGLLNSHHLPGVYFRSQPFTPSFSKYAGEACSGIQVHVTDEKRFMPIRSTLFILRETLNAHPEQFAFRDEAFDRLVGNAWVRRMLIESRAI